MRSRCSTLIRTYVCVALAIHRISIFLLAQYVKKGKVNPTLPKCLNLKYSTYFSLSNKLQNLLEYTYLKALIYVIRAKIFHNLEQTCSNSYPTIKQTATKINSAHQL